MRTRSVSEMLARTKVLPGTQRCTTGRSNHGGRKRRRHWGGRVHQASEGPLAEVDMSHYPCPSGHTPVTDVAAPVGGEEKDGNHDKCW